jgi:hypothetical protein
MKVSDLLEEIAAMDAPDDLDVLVDGRPVCEVSVWHDGVRDYLVLESEEVKAGVY